MMLLNLPPTVFDSTADAEQAAKLMELEHNEYKVVVDPTGTGKCIVAVLDPVDGMEIGKI
jgi:hypothetical protein